LPNNRTLKKELSLYSHFGVKKDEIRQVHQSKFLYLGMVFLSFGDDFEVASKKLWSRFYVGRIGSKFSPLDPFGLSDVNTIQR
jgi:hypothetical protein